MIYLENTTNPQELWISKQSIDNYAVTPYEQGYNNGYHDGYNSGFGDGYTDGVVDIANQFTTTAITENGYYEKPTEFGAFSSVTVNVHGDGYDEGYADGEAAQKARLSSINITENGNYTRRNGYSAITVNVPTVIDRYDEGYADGQTAQAAEDLAKLETTTIRTNGTFTPTYGYSSVTVNVSNGTSFMCSGTVTTNADSNLYYHDDSYYVDNNFFKGLWDAYTSIYLPDYGTSTGWIELDALRAAGYTLPAGTYQYKVILAEIIYGNWRWYTGSYYGYCNECGFMDVASTSDITRNYYLE